MLSPDVNKSSRAEQETAVGEGLAVGAVLLHIDSVSNNKATSELNFRRAWREWGPAHLFPAIHAGPSRDSLIHILSASSRRATPHLAHWVGEWPFIPEILVDWPLVEVAEHVDERVTANAWSTLVNTWLVD